MSIKPTHCGSRPDVVPEDDEWLERNEKVIPSCTMLKPLFQWFGKVTIDNLGHKIACDKPMTLAELKACPDFGIWSDGCHSCSTDSISGV